MRARSTATLIVLATFVVVGGACSPPAASPVRTVASVDLQRYLGTWYEVASVKQFFSVGLVNSKAEYSLRSDGSVLVRNSGRYGSAQGLESVVVGSAVPVDATDARLNVSFTGFNSGQPPGNYWVVALDSSYQWAVISDPTGLSCFVLTRDRFPDAPLVADLLERAREAGVDTSAVTRTPQL